MDDLEDGIEAGDFEKFLDAFGWAEDGHVAALVSNRSPDGHELAESGTVDVIDARKIQNEALPALREETIHKITERQVEDPQSAGQVEDHDVGRTALDNLQRHMLDSIPRVNY